MDNINNPPHYKVGSISTIDFIRSQLGEKAALGFCIGNVIKYASRCSHKDNAVDDLRKAAWYANYAANIIEEMPV